MGRSVGIALAVMLHVGFILFGGLIVGGKDEDQETLQVVDLLSEADVAPEKEKEQEPDPAAETVEELETEVEEVPDAAEIIRNLELAAVNDAPALEAASLSAIEAALSGQGGGGDFSSAVSLASGGRIGGKGKAGALDQGLEDAFDITQIDQRARVISQPAPRYPAEMRSKRLEGVVTVIFVVDPSGRVVSSRVEKSSHVAFEKPALDAVRQWKFEPALKGGERVSDKVRITIRLQPG
jgi:periplasmic protein TonB